MDVTHDAVDFISSVDTPFVWELNIWYHTLNCGFTTRISGETDFPCITDARVGGGRSYVHLPQTLTYDAWCEGVRIGRSYVSDGFSHLLNFAANGLEVGTNAGELRIERPGMLRVTVQAASLLPETSSGPPTPSRVQSQWSPEYARVAGSRDVAVEAIVNGHPVASQRLAADGSLRDSSRSTSRFSEAPGLRSASSALPTRTRFSFWSASARFARRKRALSGASRLLTSAGRRNRRASFRRSARWRSAPMTTRDSGTGRILSESDAD